MFYVLIFSILAVVLIVAGIGGMSRRRKSWEQDEEVHAAAHTDADRRARKAKRAQSRHDRRKRH
jgi:hypothetical protein